jgi:hypothetical protein
MGHFCFSAVSGGAQAVESLVRYDDLCDEPVPPNGSCRHVAAGSRPCLGQEPYTARVTMRAGSACAP